MTTPHPSTAPAALVRACERLVAERGFKGVTASEVVRLAEQRNNSAIAYHFGSWEGLLDAVWARHSGPINDDRRRLLAAAGTKPSLRRLVAVYVDPIVSDMQRHRPSYWARFNEQWLTGVPLDVFRPPPVGPGSGEHNPQPAEVSDLTELFQQITARLTHLAVGDRSRRVALMARFVIAALAAWERDQPRDPSPAALSELGAELVGLALAVLRAPSPTSAEIA
jgi:AcrR family transcriptional regulator